MRIFALNLVVLALGMGACGGTSSANKKDGEPVEERIEVEIEERVEEGVKPHHVPCDPEHPELPCTPDGAPEGLIKPPGSDAPADEAPSDAPADDSE